MPRSPSKTVNFPSTPSLGQDPAHKTNASPTHEESSIVGHSRPQANARPWSPFPAPRPSLQLQRPSTPTAAPASQPIPSGPPSLSMALAHTAEHVRNYAPHLPTAPLLDLECASPPQPLTTSHLGYDRNRLPSIPQLHYSSREQMWPPSHLASQQSAPSQSEQQGHHPLPPPFTHAMDPNQMDMRDLTPSPLLPLPATSQQEPVVQLSLQVLPQQALPQQAMSYALDHGPWSMPHAQLQSCAPQVQLSDGVPRSDNSLLDVPSPLRPQGPPSQPPRSSVSGVGTQPPLLMPAHLKLEQQQMRSEPRPGSVDGALWGYISASYEEALPPGSRSWARLDELLLGDTLGAYPRDHLGMYVDHHASSC